MSAHPPLRPSPVHFHSYSASPPLDSTQPRGTAVPYPVTHPGCLDCLPYTHLGRLSPAPLKKKQLICAMLLSPGTKHAAPACSARVHPAWKGAQGGGGGPRKVSRTGPAAREPSAGSCASAQSGSAPGRAAYQQNETRGDRRTESFGFPVPRCPAARPPHPAPWPRCSPSGRPEPEMLVAASAPPPARAPSPVQGRFAAVINKEGRQAHPSKSCCMRPSQPPRTVLFKTRLTNMRNLSPQCCASPTPLAGFLEQAASKRERERASKRERDRGA